MWMSKEGRSAGAWIWPSLVPWLCLYTARYQGTSQLLDQTLREEHGSCDLVAGGSKEAVPCYLWASISNTEDISGNCNETLTVELLHGAVNGSCTDKK